MARIPQAEIERLKAEVSVERLVEASGIALRRAGKDLLGRCPFHEDAQASLVVTPAKNLWHCFGCQSGGGPIDWVMKHQGVSFRHAVEILRAGHPLVVDGLAAKAVKQSTVPKLPAPVAMDADDRALLAQVVGYYHETLKASPEALAYLERRGIGSQGAIDRFRLGFANRTLGLRLPEKNRKEGEAIRTRLQRLGVLRESGHEHFNGSLVIPVTDESGSVTELYGRKIRDDLRPGTAYHLYLPGPHQGVWNIEAFAASKEVILCEALIDALTFWCAGFRNVTAAYGVAGFTDDHLAAFKRYGTERVLIAYDRDDAGDRAAEKLAVRLAAEGIECWRIQFPKGMDANDYALKVAPATKSLGLAIRKALWMGKGEAPVTSAPEAVTPLAAKEKTIGALPATPVPPVPAPEPAAELKESEVVIVFGEGEHARRYRVRGLARNASAETMKVNLLVARNEAFHVDTLDLYAARARASYVTQAAVELKVAEEIVKADLGRVLLKLEALQEEALAKMRTPPPAPAATLTVPEREAALDLLRAPNLAERILADFEACGIVGERVNTLVGYLAATSRKLERPLAVAIQSSSAAGKSSLMDAILALMPEEERVKYSAMTGQSLFYMGATNLRHKILALVEEEGAARASYALKLLQSEGELTIASTGKDPATGNLVTQEYRVEGPVMIFLTTTAADLDEELQNRCLVFAIDEGREQTRAIHRLQRERRTLEGLIARAEREDLVALHRNAQRLLRPLAVLNPYARQLTFPDEATRTRRDHEKYLTLIDTIALLHQYQREVKVTTRKGKTVEYVEATLDDIALANRLAHEVLGRSLDELPPQTRRLLMRLDEFVTARAKDSGIERAGVRFTRRELREAIGLGDTQLRLHLDRLVALEYLALHRHGAGGRFVYELFYDGQGTDGRPFVPGLIDVEALRAATTTANSRGRDPEVAGRLRGDRGPLAGGSRTAESPRDSASAPLAEESALDEARTHSSGGNGQDPSYAHLPLAAQPASS
jgi:DNA primase catalytic core